MNVFPGIFPENLINLSYRQLKPERNIEEISRSPREEHTQKRYVPVAMNSSLKTTSRWKPGVPKPRPKGGKIAWRIPSTMQLNRSNVKRKPSARGRTR